MMLKTALVAISLSLPAPKIRVMAIPNTRKMTMMLRPYISASPMERRRLRFFLRKKLRVIGIIGHTQGVSRASRPPTNPISSSIHAERCVEGIASESPKAAVLTGFHQSPDSVSATVSSAALPEWPFVSMLSVSSTCTSPLSPIEALKSAFLGGRQLVSVQAIYSTSLETVTLVVPGASL